MAYSDFPIPADYPNYMHHSKILDYFRMYAQHFKLMQHIRFQVSVGIAQRRRDLTTVLIHPLSLSNTPQSLVKSVRQTPDFLRSGNWEVVIEKTDGEEEKHVFDAVICCSGHYSYPNMPLKDFPGKRTKTFLPAGENAPWLLGWSQKHRVITIVSIFCAEGIGTFKGTIFHSWDYKGPEDMDGKRVVVVGIGNSGGDIAVESSRVAKQVKIRHLH